jgi:hypothetical protein
MSIPVTHCGLTANIVIPALSRNLFFQSWIPAQGRNDKSFEAFGRTSRGDVLERLFFQKSAGLVLPEFGVGAFLLE